MADCRTGAENTQDEPGAPSSARKVLTKQKSKKPEMGTYGKDTGEKIYIVV